MDCPVCNAAMQADVANEATHGWWCPNHGYFAVACTCGVLTGQAHDVLCKKANAEEGTDGLPW